MSVSQMQKLRGHVRCGAHDVHFWAGERSRAGVIINACAIIFQMGVAVKYPDGCEALHSVWMEVQRTDADTFLLVTAHMRSQWPNNEKDDFLDSIISETVKCGFQVMIISD